MKKATLAEFDQEEAEWRETAEGQVLNLCEIEEPLPTPEELDELDPDEAIRRIKTWSRTTRSFALPLKATSAPGVRWLSRASRRGPRHIKPSLNRRQSEKAALAARCYPSRRSTSPNLQRSTEKGSGAAQTF